MKPACLLALAVAAAAALDARASLEPSAIGQWPQWRGPLATGEAPDADPPLEWSERTNVRWKVPIPGMGASTPIIWNDTIYLQTAVEIGDEKPPRQAAFAFPEQMKVYKGRTYVRAIREHEFSLVAIDRATGALRWRRVLRHGTAETLAVNRLDDGFDASPAVVGNELYLRGRQSLYRISR